MYKGFVKGVFVVFTIAILCASYFAAVGVVYGGDDNGCCCDGGYALSYVGRDYTTKGNWIESGYGDCGYALPYAEPNEREVAIGETTAINFTDTEFWWRTPWSVLPADPNWMFYPYQDYLGGYNILEYEIIGPEGPPRPLANSSGSCYRPTWYNGSLINVTINVSGDYRLALYFLDWEKPKIIMNVTVSSGGASETVTLGEGIPGNYFYNGLAGGVYAIFDVHSDDNITITIEKGNGDGAILSGVFLDEIAPVSGVSFVGLDRETMGNWRGVYGGAYYLLAGFNAPAVGDNTFDYSYDETNMAGLYVVSDGVVQYAADDAKCFGEYPFIGRYAAYAWADKTFDSYDTSRVLTYPTVRFYYGYPPTLNEKIYGVWDSGEFGWFLNYFIIKLKIPEGKYLLSLYVMDLEGYGRSETIEIWDENMTAMLDSQYINASEINDGVYVQWYVEGSSVINIKVIADQGNLNSFVNGIFLNCICSYDGKTIGFWKNNIRKAISDRTKGIQVSREEILDALREINATYGEDSSWGFSWLTFKGSDQEILKDAYKILRFRHQARSMEAKARAQILALLLTTTHFEEDGCWIWVPCYEDGKAAIAAEWINLILTEYKNGNYEVAKDLADYINNL